MKDVRANGDDMAKLRPLPLHACTSYDGRKPPPCKRPECKAIYEWMSDKCNREQMTRMAVAREYEDHITSLRFVE